MRIAIVSRRYWPAVGGVERAALELAEALAVEHDVRVVAQRVDDGPYGRMTHVLDEAPIFAPFEHNGIPIAQFRPSRRRRAALLPFAWGHIPVVARIGMTRLRIPMSAWYTRVVGPVLAPLLADADVVHVHGGEMLAAGTVRVAHALDIPVVITPFAHPGEWGDDGGSAWAYRNAEAVVATLPSEAATYTLLGVGPDRLHVAGLVTRQPTAAPVALPVAEDDQVVLFLGGRRPNKGWELVLEAARRLRHSHPRARFAFVGPGEPLPDPPANALDIGAVSDAEREAWLRRADLLCLISSSETFGLVVTEAWSARTPVVVSDIAVLRELVEPARGGLVVPRDPGAVARAVAQLLDDPQERRVLGEAGHAVWAERYTPAAVAARHVTIYERAWNLRHPS